MTYRELFDKANRLVDTGEITLGEYEEMTKPLDRDIECLDKIKAEIEQMDFDFGDFYDHTDSIVKMVLQVIDKYKESEE